jgi:hypothetical protein
LVKARENGVEEKVPIDTSVIDIADSSTAAYLEVIKTKAIKGVFFHQARF